jgi:tetratricopeptide (TPR) repeat protein
LDDLRSQNEVLRYFIGEDQYNANKELLDKIEQNIIGEAEDRKNKVKESVQSAYGSIINNALEGIKFLKTDENGLPNRQEVAQYLIKFVAPLVQQIEDSGGTVSQEIKDAITNAYGIGDPSLSMLDIQGGERRKKVLDNFIREYLGLDENNVYEMDIKLKFKEYFDNAPTQGSYYGMGNIDLNNRQILNNGDGSFSTENSSTIEIDGKYIVIPTVVDGKQLELDEAIENYKQTGKHLGIFDTLEDSEAYAQQLHERQEQFYQAQFIKDQALEVLAGMNNGDIDRYNYDQRILQLVQDYGSDIVQKVLDQIGEEYGWNWKGNSGTNPVNMGNRSFVNPLEGTVGSVAKTPDYNPMYRPTTTTEPASGGIDYNQMANSMATAATSANQNVVSELQSIMMQLSRILNKDWTVVVKPSADWGQHNQRSGNMWNRSSGENY